ncbi:MAG TPA: ABC transporter permease [Terriglobia bacterium]|nr:ABC transporter permease [Terriglobia bacterium]
MQTLWQDLRYALRMLARSPGFAAVAVLTLALGIGANAAIFQLIDAVRLRTLPVQDPSTLAIVHLNTNHWGSGNFTGPYSEFTFPLWQEVQKRQQAFSSIAAWGGTQLNLARSGEVDNAQAIWISGQFFQVLGVQPILGRLISPADDPEDEQAGCSGAVDLSYAFWQRRYGGDASVIGKTLTLEGHPFPIVGVTPPSFFGVSVGDRFDLAVPICAEPLINGQYSHITGPRPRETWWLALLGRLKPGWTVARAGAQLESIAPAALRETVPPQYDAEGVKHYLGYKLEARPAANGFSNMRQGASDPLYLLLGLSALVLLIACANLANLLLARASAREREVAVRLALGASRARLIRQLLSESALVAVAGAMGGGFLAAALSRALIAFVSTPDNPVFLDMPTDWRVLGFAAALAILTTLLFGLAPALRAGSVNPGSFLKAGGRGMTAGREHFRLQRILVASQVALSVVLLAGALLFARSLQNLMTRNPGFRQNGVLIAAVDTGHLKLSLAQGPSYEENLLEHIRALPGVAAAAISERSPVSGNSSNDWVLDAKGNHPNGASWEDYISPGYFETMEIPLMAGRDFTVSDSATSPKVAIVNQAFVKTFLGGTTHPIGAEIRVWAPPGKPPRYYQVVGLVKDSVYNDMHEPMVSVMYFARAQTDEPQLFSWASVLIRSRGGLGGLLNSVKNEVASVNPESNIQFRLLRTQIHDSLLQDELMATLCGFFGGLALLLAALGLYGVISYTVTQRTNEIGIRMALGSQRAGVIHLILGEVAILVGIGLAVGVGLTLAGSKAASSMLFGLKPRDPLTLALTVLILAAIGFGASFLPARRASRLDPMTALRYE